MNVWQCVQVLDRRAGVCRDDVLGGVNSYQLFMSRREDGLTIVTFRRSLKPGETTPSIASYNNFLSSALQC